MGAMFTKYIHLYKEYWVRRVFWGFPITIDTSDDACYKQGISMGNFGEKGVRTIR